MTISNLLLSTFAKNLRFGTDIKSMHKRFQILSIIYVNLIHFGICATYELTSSFTTNTFNYAVTLVTALTTIIVLCLLRQGHSESAIAATIAELLCINFYEGHVLRQPLSGIYGLMMVAGFAFCLSPSFKTQIIFFICASYECRHYISIIKEIFKVTLSADQEKQMNLLYAASYNCLLFICILCIVQKKIEAHIWQMAQSSYEKSENLTKEVLQASESKDIFVSSLSHEIRNPLNALNGSIDYLLEIIQDTHQLQILKNAKLSSEVILNLANNVLDAAKLKSDKMDVIRSESSFVDIIKKTFIINSEKLKAKTIRAETFIDERVPKFLWIDSSRLLQIMMNLISNALKFTPNDGSIKIYVSWHSENTAKEKLIAKMDYLELAVNSVNNYADTSVQNTTIDKNASLSEQLADFSICEEFNLTESLNRLRNPSSIKTFHTKHPQDNKSSSDPQKLTEPWSIFHVPLIKSRDRKVSLSGYLKVQVSDTGVGIPSEKIPKLFSMFEQAHQSAGNMYGGTGLGLWICKQICHKMNGDIALYSEIDEGTTFVFYIPVNNDQHNALSLFAADAPRRNVNVLVVDDYAVNRELHKLLLQREGATVVTASSGREALDKYKGHPEGHFDVIMMDVFMPDIDGFKAAKLIKQFEVEENRKKVDICFVTGEYFDEEEVTTSFKQIGGAVMASEIKCMRKPIDIVMIRNLVISYQVSTESATH